MAYCSECGREVGENDIFCPYCGISLQPMTFVGEKYSQNNTNVSQESENLESDENLSAKSEDSAANKDFVGQTTNNYSNDITAENQI